MDSTEASLSSSSVSSQNALVPIKNSRSPYYLNNGDHPVTIGKKDKPICSHCGFRGHTVDKCYKLHGYPPGFKGKSRAPVSANQVSRPFIHGCSEETQNLTHLAAQCQQFLNMLTSQVQQIAPSNEASTFPTPHTAALVTSNRPSHVTSNMTVCSSEWILDTGATDHMVINTQFFTTMSHVNDVTVGLPNGLSLSVTHIGPSTLEDDWFG
uniref:Retrovirus-related Pol polyprotein from transposon TNT 1-94-like beta-barrel domain-containing protein n=1 Tax=Fagus sylvatica TaxID=28930 RepID=A0A2N9HIL3_FAGSY